MKKDTSSYFGIEKLDEAKKRAVMSFIGMRGKVYRGYGNDGFIRKTVNCLDYYMHVKIYDDNSSIVYMEPYFHNSSMDVIKMNVDNPVIDVDHADRNHKTVSGFTEKGSCYVVMNLINADTLPSFVTGTSIEAQVIAYPYGKINVYANENEYCESVTKSGGIFYHDGSVLPVGYIDRYISPLKDKSDGVDAVFLRGRISAIKKRKSELFFEREYYQASIWTDMGELSIICTDDQISGEDENTLSIGSIISGTFWLEGDAAIYQYENYSLQRSDVLALLQNTFELGDPERLRKVLSPDVVFKTISSDEEYKGIDAVIERLNYVTDNIRSKVFAHIGEIIRKKDDEDKRKEFGKGTDCVVIAYDNPRYHEGIAFINRDKNHLISRLTIESSSDYIYKIKSPKERKGYE